MIWLIAYRGDIQEANHFHSKQILTQFDDANKLQWLDLEGTSMSFYELKYI